MTAFVVGFPFGATHLGYWALGPVVVAFFALSSALMCLAMWSIWTGGFWQRMVPCTLVHAGVNVGLLAVPADLADAPAWTLPIPALAALAVVGPLGLWWRRRSVGASQ